MVLMTLHDEPKQKHSVHIFRRLGALGYEHFWKKHVSKCAGRNRRNPSVARVRVTSHRSSRVLIAFWITLKERYGAMRTENLGPSSIRPAPMIAIDFQQGSKRPAGHIRRVQHNLVDGTVWSLDSILKGEGAETPCC